MKLILKPSEITAEMPIGGKARALWRLGSTGLNIPGWIVVLPQAYEIWQSLTQQGLLEEDLRSAVLSALPDAKVFAVRSSAIDEDGAEHSFAGQLDSFLFVQPDQLLEKVRAVWASGFSERMAAYRSERGLSLARQAPAVLIQRMIDAEAAGVAFGADPVSGQRGTAVISSAWGLGSALVGGDADADVFRVDRTGTILERTIVEKKTAHRSSCEGTEGVKAESVPAHLQKQSSLSDAQLLEVADLVRATGRHFGRPQDIEWAMKEDQIYLLQSRPITSLANLADPDGALNLWDNSNIAESYNGVTTPLTFSFARGVYEEVYRQFCRIMGVREEKIADHRGTFRRMLGLIQGRIYYNLVSWYRVLALLPGFQINRPFMEQMMGVKEGLPAAILAEFENTPTLRVRLHDRADLARSLLGLIWNHLTLPRKIDAFYARLNHAEPPFFMEPQNPASWPLHWTACGFTPLAEYYSALNTGLSKIDPRIARTESRLRESGITIRPLRADQFLEELRRVYAVSAISFQSNYLYTPLEEANFIAQYHQIEKRIDPRLVLLAEREGRPVGYIFAIPDLAQAQRGEAIDTVIIKTVAVLPGRAQAGLGAVLLEKIHHTAHALGYKRAIHALMHETNKSRNLSDHSAQTMRRYTLFAKRLGS